MLLCQDYRFVPNIISSLRSEMTGGGRLRVHTLLVASLWSTSHHSHIPLICAGSRECTKKSTRVPGQVPVSRVSASSQPLSAAFRWSANCGEPFLKYAIGGNSGNNAFSSSWTSSELSQQGRVLLLILLSIRLLSFFKLYRHARYRTY